MRKIFQRLLLAIILLAALGAAFWTGISWSNAHPPVVGNFTTIDLSPFWKTWEIINERFVDTTGTSSRPVSDQRKVWGAISGLVASLGDPYSGFMSPKDNKIFKEDIKGEFGGIGIEIGIRDGAPTVISPIEGTPAKRAGLKPGDQIIAVDGNNIERLTITEATELIRGEVGTVVTLTIGREGEKTNREIKITREVIKVPTIETKVLPEGIFLIKLFNFGATAPDFFREALRNFINSKTDKLIIDLRGNPGGYLDTAVDIGSWFLPNGTVVAIEDHAGRAENKVYKSHGGNIFNDRLKLVILVDGGSASAAEILAGALSEHGVARLVGEKTFGKGSVQELLAITDDTSLKLTIANWLTPAGRSISHQGITPDIVVKLPKEEKESKDDLILVAGMKALFNWTVPQKKI